MKPHGGLWWYDMIWCDMICDDIITYRLNLISQKCWHVVFLCWRHTKSLLCEIARKYLKRKKKRFENWPKVTNNQDSSLAYCCFNILFRRFFYTFIGQWPSQHREVVLQAHHQSRGSLPPHISPYIFPSLYSALYNFLTYSSCIKYFT